MKLFNCVTMLLFMLMFVFIFSCEQEQPMQVDKSPTAQSFDLAQSNVTLPGSVEWNWRRIMVQGYMTTNSMYSMQGDERDPNEEIPRADWNMEESWYWEDEDGYPYDPTRTTGSKKYGYWGMNYDHPYQVRMSGRYDTGESINDGDAVVWSAWIKEIDSDATWISPMFFLNHVGGATNDIKYMFNYLDTGVWTSVSMGTVATDDVEGLKVYFDHYGPMINYHEWYIDDIRIYSSSQYLKPPCRVKNISIENDKDEVTITGDISDWFEAKLERWECKLKFMKENVVTGLYEDLFDPDSEVYVTLDGESTSFSIREDESYLLEELKDGDRILPFLYNVDTYVTGSWKVFKHINEVDAVIFHPSH